MNRAKFAGILLVALTPAFFLIRYLIFGTTDTFGIGLFMGAGFIFLFLSTLDKKGFKFWVEEEI
jgi:hypothetical protein